MTSGIGNAFIGDLEELMAVRVLRSRSLFRMTGPSSQCWRAESDLSSTYHGSNCLLLPSATVGTALLLEALDLPADGEVLIAPFGWLSNWSCIRRAGLQARFLPLDDRLQLRPDAVRERITERTVAVVVTHLMGRGQQDVGAIADICVEYGVPLLEDVAQAFGVSVGVQRAGTFGTGAWSSLNHHKVLSVGDGGFAVVQDEELFERVCGLHDQGCVLAGGKRHPRSDLEPGLSLRVTDLSAAVLRAQLARFHLIRARVLALHDVVAEACASNLGLEVLDPSPGDLPFTVLFRRPDGAKYPSMLDAGWHVAEAVPWLADEFAQAVRNDPELEATVGHLRATAGVGAGFVDPYLAVPVGLDLVGTDDVSTVVARVKEQL